MVPQPGGKSTASGSSGSMAASRRAARAQTSAAAVSPITGISDDSPFLTAHAHHVSRPLGNSQHGRVRVRIGDLRYHRRVGDPQSADSAHPKLKVNHGIGVRSQPAGADRVVVALYAPTNVIP